MALGALLGAASAGAGDEPALESVRFGFGNRLAANTWTPVTAHVVNPTDRPATVRLAVQCAMGPDTVQYLRVVSLPPHSRRRVEGFVRFDYPPAALRRLFSPAQNKVTREFPDGTTRIIEPVRAKPVHFVARLLDVAGAAGGVGGRELSRQDLSGLLVHPDAFFLAVCDLGPAQRRGWQYQYSGLPFALGETPAADARALTEHYPEADNAFSRWSAPDAARIGRRFDMVNLATPADFPAKWAAFEGVDAVLLGRLEGNSRRLGLSPAQRHSLMAYLRSGGRVVMLPALSPDEYRDPFWEALLPVRLGAVRPVGDEFDALARPGEPKPAVVGGDDEPPHMIEAFAGEGETLVEHDGLVLLARRRVGAGEAWFFAGTGGALAQWSAGARVFGDALRPAPAALPGVKYAAGAEAADLLADVVGLEAPARGSMMALLGIYFAAAALALFLMRARGRQEAAWAAVAAFAVAATVGAGVLRAAQRRESGFIQGEIGFATLGAGEAEGTVTSLVGLYSGQARQNMNLSWTNPDTLATLQPDFAQFEFANPAGGRQLDVEEDHRFVYPNLRLDPDVLHVNRAMTLSRFGDGVALEVVFGPDGLGGFVENNTGRILFGGLLRTSRAAYHVGDLTPGARVDLAGLEASFDPLGPPAFPGAEGRRRRRLLAEATRLDFEGADGVERHYAWPVAFLAWTDDIRAGAAAGADRGILPVQRGRQLVAVVAEPAAGPGPVRLPAGLCGLLAQGQSFHAAIYGNPPRPNPGDEAPPPGEKVAAKPPPPPPPPRPEGYVGEWPIPGADAEPAAPDYSRRYEPTGWQSGREPPPAFRFRFTVPEALRGVRPTRLTVMADLEAEGLRVQWRVRRTGAARAQDGWSPLAMAAAEAGGPARAVLEGEGLAALIGPDGELPELELWMRREIGADADAGAVRWAVRMVDAEIEGIAP